MELSSGDLGNAVSLSRSVPSNEKAKCHSAMHAG